LILDIKGELAAKTMRYRAAVNDQVALLNPFKVLGLPSNGYNPVAALDTGDDFTDDAMALAEALIRIEGPDSHWGSSAQDLVCGLIMYSRLTRSDGGSLGHVRELLGMPTEEFKTEIDAMVTASIRADIDELRIKAARFIDLSPENRELQSIVSTARTQLRFLDSRPIKADLAQGAFDFGVMKQQPTTVYVNLPANRLGSHSSYLRIVLTAFLQSALKDASSAQVPVLVMLDEAAQLGDLPILRDSIALLRGYGVKVWQLFQDVPQHKAIAGDRFESSVANSGVLQAFAPQDMTTAGFLSARSGQDTAHLYSYSAAPDAFRGKPAAGSGSIGLSFAPVPGVLPQEIMGMEDGFSILFSHKTQGRVFAYLPDPSEVRAYDRVLGGSKTSG
jgi:type IV secretion system protein VirD4